MNTKDYLKELDWSLEIALATYELETCSKGAKSPNAKTYLNRGIARCFVTGKDGTHKEAIEDLSAVIVHSADPQAPNAQPTELNLQARYYRAYAYYLDGDYASAIADCEFILEKNKQDNITVYAHELLGKIYYAMNRYKEAADAFGEALKSQFLSVASPGIMESYREACRRMNNV